MTESAGTAAGAYWVSYRSVVHSASGKCSGTRYPWDPATRYDFDRACHNCLPEGLPQ